MKTIHIHRLVTVSVVLAAAFTTGCASMAVSNDAIEQNTAFALGLEKGTFAISNRVDEGIKSTYSVKTDTGKKYSCYVTGAVSIAGRVVSDAICNEIGKPTEMAKPAEIGKPAKPAKPKNGTGASCNALLKAAGKC